MDKIINQIKDTKLLSQIERVVLFHGYLSTGAFIGIQMFNIAQQILGLQDEERIYATCETYNCIPDAFQILGGATIGNKRMKIIDNGKMAVVINRYVPTGVTSECGIRIYLDPNKTQKYPGLHAWYLNTQKVSHEEAIYDLIDAGEDVYSYEMVKVDVPIKPAKYVTVCKRCGEYFVCKDDETLCNTCAA
jgi:formylmethanofuran dehydrogenase subunit E